MTNPLLADYEGVGVYQRLGRVRRPAEELVWGVYSLSGLGQVPGEDELIGALTVTSEEGGLVAIQADKQALAVEALDLMQFAPERTDVDPIVGQASFVVADGKTGWVAGYVANGFLVMVKLDTVATAAPRVMATRSAETVARYATRAGGYAMVAGPADLWESAYRVAAAPATSPCPSGFVRDAGTGGCVVAVRSTEPDIAQSAAPSWLLPVAVGAAVVTLGALLLKG